MKHIRFIAGGREQTGMIRHDGVVTDAAGCEYESHDIDVWLPPAQPNKMIGLALNYADHADELGLEKPAQPVLFIKPNSSLIGHQGVIDYPDGATYMHYENELVVVIARHGRKVKASEAMDYVRGYTIGNDVTVRDFVTNMYRPPVRAKGHDTFGPLGPCLVDRDDISEPDNLTLKTYVNGELKQEGNTRDLIYTIPELIEYISSFMTLEPNDMIWTGTPKGISHIYPGDHIKLEISGIGVLENTVKDGRSDSREHNKTTSRQSV